MNNRYGLQLKQLFRIAVASAACAITAVAAHPPALGPDSMETHDDTPPLAKPPAPEMMAQYFMVFLHRGPKWSAEQTPESRKLFEGHMAHMNQMAAEGKLVLAGPFTGPSDKSGTWQLAGIAIYNVATIEETKRLASLDPAVQAERFTVEIIPWYGPKMLQQFKW